MKKCLLYILPLLLILSCEDIPLRDSIDELTLGWTREVVYKSPENNADVAEKTPLLDWEDAGGASGYELQIVEAEDQFESADIIKTEESEYEVPAGLTICESRYWRVRAVQGSKSGEWSKSRKFSIAVSSSPKLIGQLDTSDGFPLNPLGLAIKGDYAFITTVQGGDQLSVINISDPENPVLSDSFDYDPKLSIVLSGNYIYCKTNAAEETIIKLDVSNPLIPVQEGAALVVNYDDGSGEKNYQWNMSYDVSGGGSGTLVTAYDNNDNPTSAGILALDFEDPDNPSVMGFMLETTGQPFGITTATTTGLVTVNGEGVYSFSLIGQTGNDLYEISTMDRGWVAAEGNYAFVGNLDGPLTILDISDRTSLQHVYTYDPGEGTLLPAVSGYYLFTGLFTSGKFTIMDIRDPAAPILVSQGSAGQIGEIVGNLAYGFDYADSKFYIWDLVPGD